jgi:hypothetical protein
MKIKCSYKRKQKFKPSGSTLRCKNDSMKVLHKINILKRNLRSNCIITARNSEMGFYELVFVIIIEIATYPCRPGHLQNLA